MRKQFLILLVLFSFNFAVAQTSGPDSTEKSYAPYLHPEYHFNVEYNPGFTVWALGEEESIVISTGFSWFSRKRAAEFVIPVFIEATTHKSDWFDLDYKGSAVTVDLRYREYLMGKIGGLFGAFGISWHYLNLNRLPGTDTYITGERPSHFQANRFGFGFGAGYRAFSEGHLNWTIGIFVGSYIYSEHKDNPLLGYPWMQTVKGGMVRVQLLKFGYAW